MLTSPSTSSAPRRRGPRGDLTLDGLVEAACVVVRAQGAAALSLRAVARELGVAPNALYTYVADLPELAMLAADSLLARLDLAPLSAVLPVDEALRRFMRGAWCVFADNPQLAALVADQRIIGPGALALNEALLACLTRGGLGLAEADEAVQALTAWLFGALRSGVDGELAPQHVRALGRLDPADYPLTAGRTPVSDPLFGLEIVLRGVAPGRG